MHLQRPYKQKHKQCDSNWQPSQIIPADTHMVFIDAHNFVRERSKEIETLEDALLSHKKKSMLFQRLPFYKRRRSASHDRVRKKHGNSNYYSKRFRMISVHGHRIAHRRFEKICSLLHKGHSFLFHMAYYTGHVYAIDEEIERAMVDIVHYDIEDAVQENSTYDVRNYYNRNNQADTVLSHSKHILFRTRRFLILLTCGDVPAFLQDRTVHARTEGVYRLLKEPSYSAPGVYRPGKGVLHRTDTAVDDYLTSANDDCVLKLNDVFSFILVFKNTGRLFGDMIRIWRMIGLDEYMRLSLDYQFLVWPFDDVGTDWYREYEKEVFADDSRKYFRTPKGKRSDYLGCAENSTVSITDSDPPFIFPFRLPDGLCPEHTHFFECAKGSLARCARVYDGPDSETVSGYVVRSGFCYSIGRCRGILVLYDTWNKDRQYYGANVRSSQRHAISIV